MKREAIGHLDVEAEAQRCSAAHTQRKQKTTNHQIQPPHQKATRGFSEGSEKRCWAFPPHCWWWTELQSSQWQNLHLTTERLFVPIPRRERGNCCLPYPSRSPTCHVHHRKASILSPLATTEEPRWRTETHQETLLLSSIRAAALFLHCFRFRSRV